LSQPGTAVHLQVHGFGSDHRKQEDECQADQKDTEFDVFSDHRKRFLSAE
jgi:hypothetical protein